MSFEIFAGIALVFLVQITHLIWALKNGRRHAKVESINLEEIVETLAVTIATELKKMDDRIQKRIERQTPTKQDINNFQSGQVIPGVGLFGMED